MLAIGGYDFGADPKLDFDSQPIFWIPEALPTALHIAATKEGMTIYPLTADSLIAGPATQVHSDDAGRDVIVHRRGAVHRLWIEDPSLMAGTVAVVLPVDLLFDHRSGAAMRFWRALKGLSPGADPMPLTAYVRDQLTLVLRLLDAEHSGATEREMGEFILGARAVNRRDWMTSDSRTRLRRLLRKGHELLAGGYFRLLCPAPRAARATGQI